MRKTNDKNDEILIFEQQQQKANLLSSWSDPGCKITK